MNLLPRHHPSLPQNDGFLERTARALQLDISRLAYSWSTDFPAVEGIPMASKVIFNDQPSIEWLLKVGEVAIKIAENQLALKFSSKVVTPAHESLSSIKALIAELRTAHDNGLKGDIKIASSAMHLLSTHHESLMQQLHQLQDMINDNQLEDGDGDGDLAMYKDLFKTLPLPLIASTFTQDDTFAQLRVAGPNPMLLRRISQLPAKFPLSQAQFQQVTKTDSLALAASENRLFLLDYAELQSLVDQPGETDGQPKFVYAPIALFALSANRQSLQPIAIQCGQDPSQYPLFLKPDSSSSPEYWSWQMAKSVVQVAECNYHELFVHLARTHLVMEAFTVATHRHLASCHPIHILLIPHFEGTLFINNSAASSLIAAGGAIDQTFGATITASQQASGKARLDFDFYANMLPSELASRGVDDPNILPNYPYRDDALLVWNAIREWTKDYVNTYYTSDIDVTADTELSHWTQELIEDGLIKGFRPITSRQQLSDVLTMVIFTGSAQHAAVNFPQTPDMSYAPAIAGAGWSSAPANKHQSQSDWLALMPPRSAALEQLNLLELLGSVHYRSLGEYRNNDFPYLAWFEDKAITQNGGPLDRFQANLKSIEAVITERNNQRTFKYPFLLPSQIPPSINI
jgi:arachidonate 15-lipoxygenase